MARYILISSASGYIMGDTADFAAGRQSDIADITEAARMLDEEISGDSVEYAEYPGSPPDGADGYYVYRADINGSEAVPVVIDGTDEDTITSVTAGCELVGFVERIPA